ncbi:uncharacterized protein LOC115562997 [Drosophila navojoa]|uniref:uncharacterized protein LOC115562997 n=1 Tax=Drosophila navojoa TaxID=7232 RepID=UPI0011BFBD1B|nr:uncharacterized protein LOC115562997 [Drosophila navojoa]
MSFSKKSKRIAKKKTSKTSEKAAVAELTEEEKPTLSQTFATLRICLRYGESTASIFTRLFKLLENTNLVRILKVLPDDELGRLLPMLAERLTRLRVEMSEIPELCSISNKMGVKELRQVRHCEVAQDKTKLSGNSSSCNLQLLGELLPLLEVLNVHAAIVAPFPDNFRNLQSLMLRQGIHQLVLDQICAHCPQLQKLLLRNESSESLDAKNLLKCFQLKELQMPLMLRSPQAVCYLTHLQHLSLQRLQLWPGMDWLPNIKEILSAKRCQLRVLSFDGSWLVTPLDLSLLQLGYCWGLQELLLSNCKLADLTSQPELPLSCRRFGLRGCKLNRPLRYFRNIAQVQLLELHDCQLASDGRPFLQYMILQRQRQPAFAPLLLRFSQSTPMRAELAGWTARYRQEKSAWLKVIELEEGLHTWQQPIGTITMTFGKPIDHMPELDLGGSARKS